MCALAKGNLLPGASSRLEAESPNHAGRYDGRGEDRGSPAELLRATRLSRLAGPVSDQRHFVALLYTLSRDTTQMRDARGKTSRPWAPQPSRPEAQSPEAKLPQDDRVCFVRDTVPRLDVSRVSAASAEATRGAPPFAP